METTTLTIGTDLLRETLIALRDRQQSLLTERQRHTMNDALCMLIDRQLVRVLAAQEAIGTELGERF